MNKLIDDLKNNNLQIGTGDKMPTWTQEDIDGLRKALNIIFAEKTEKTEKNLTSSS